MEGGREGGRWTDTESVIGRRGHASIKEGTDANDLFKGALEGARGLHVHCLSCWQRATGARSKSETQPPTCEGTGHGRPSILTRCDRTTPPWGDREWSQALESGDRGAEWELQ